MRQVVAIHGGDSFANYQDFLDYLRNEQIESIERFKPRNDWKENLPATLGQGYEVLLPKMPNKQNARYLEWQIWFEKITPFLGDGVVLVGHSLGGAFLARYLSENRFPKTIAATFLVATPFDEGKHGDARGDDFIAPDSLSLLTRQGGKIFLYHSKDDPVVPFAEFEKYRAHLPGAIARVFTDRAHFNQESFPEIVTDIVNL